MAELQEQQEQRSVHRPHLGHQGALLPALYRRAPDLREAAAEQRAVEGGLRALDPRHPVALLRAVAIEGARELEPALENAGL